MFYPNTLNQTHTPKPTVLPVNNSDIHLAAATLMFKVIESDGNKDHMEIAHMVEILRNQFSLSVTEIEALLDAAKNATNAEVDVNQLTQQLCNQLDRRERFQLLNDFWQIATADETILPGERTLIDKIARQLQLDKDDITRARYRAEQKLELNIA